MNDSTFGSFSGPVLAEWLADGRSMRILRELTFRDPAGCEWCVPEGALIDGASIPRLFWSGNGGPYEGLYRDASVVHDYECCVKLRLWAEVHRMFWWAMRARGEAKWRADLMYYAVRHFGPRWSGTAPERLALRELAESPEQHFQRAAAYFQAHPEIRLEEVDRLEPPEISAQAPAARAADLPRTAGAVFVAREHACTT